MQIITTYLTARFPINYSKVLHSPMKQCIHQFKNKNLIHATVLDNGTKTDFTCSLTAFNLTHCQVGSPRAVAKADHHSAETESESESCSHVRDVEAAAELRQIIPPFVTVVVLGTKTSCLAAKDGRLGCDCV